MTFELLRTIAMLCLIGGNGSNPFGGYNSVDQHQLECQKYYIDCTYEETGRLNVDINKAKMTAPTLRKCIQRRNISK